MVPVIIDSDMEINRPMIATKLYKYLDIKGGLAMLNYSNLQFTNATQLNDPFDCHPSLIDFSNAPDEACGGWTPETIGALRMDKNRRTREEAWICSLSKKHDSILMWSYYCNHEGICIGIDMEKAKKYLSQIRGKFTIGCSEIEVQYKDVVDKPNYFRDTEDFFHYQLSTKAKAWAHEQEVRLFILDPSPEYFRLSKKQYKQYESNGTIFWKEARAYHKIGGECFESVYLGVNINLDEKSKIISVARNLNPNINIYQMTIDTNAFKLNDKLI